MEAVRRSEAIEWEILDTEPSDLTEATAITATLVTLVLHSRPATPTRVRTPKLRHRGLGRRTVAPALVAMADGSKRKHAYFPGQTEPLH